MLALLLANVLASSSIVRVAKAQPKTITVPDEYPTIQAAINGANEGDRIYVKAGTYAEHIEVNKSLTLEGESKENTILNVQAKGQGFQLIGIGIQILASNVVIRNFRITSDSTVGNVLLFVDGRNNAILGNVIRDNILINNDDSIVIDSSGNNQVLNNTVINVRSKGACIACLFGSDYNVISNNTATGGWTGIYLDLFSSMNYVSCNTVENQIPESRLQAGAVTSSGPNNVFVGNTVTNNTLGIYLESSSLNNTVFHNNFVGNVQQTYIASIVGSTFVWDEGYPSGGNYWSDYNGTDHNRGPGQNVTGSDGIGDTPYVIGTGNVDHYPLMYPWPRLIGDVNGDGKVLIDDLLLVVSAFGSNSGDPRWNPFADVNGDGRVRIDDALTVALNFGKTRT
jgi:parallel beta-helix repeat protein